MLGRRKLPSHSASSETLKRKKWQTELDGPERANLASSPFESSPIPLSDSLTHSDDESTSMPNQKVIKHSQLSDCSKDSFSSPLSSPSLSAIPSTVSPLIQSTLPGSSPTNEAELPQSISNPDPDTQPSKQGKSKRYEWMDSEDEDVSGSSEEKESLSSTDENSNMTTKCAYLSNISWDSKLEDVVKWLQQQCDCEVVSISPYISRSSSTTQNAKYGNQDHKGRAFVEVKSYKQVENVLELNDRSFYGRNLRISKAYKENGLFFVSDGSAPYGPPSYRAQQRSETTSTRYPPAFRGKRAKVDGGFNWAR